MKKVFHLFAVAMCSVLILTVVSCQEKNNPEENGGISSNPVQAVDLGLPSGIKWANMNVGATKPEEYGAYFAWGETKPKDKYIWITYFDAEDEGNTFIKYYNNGGKTSLDLEDDAAYVNWGADWRMPTKAELDELRTNCNWTWAENYNETGVKGYMVSSKTNSNSIFLPAAGYYQDSKLNNVEIFGVYYASSLSEKKSSKVNVLSFYQNDVQIRDGGERYFGQSVRPVCK